MKNLVILCIMLAPFAGFGQATDEAAIIDLFRKSRAIYESAPVFGLETRFTSYASADSDYITAQYEGKSIKNGTDFYSKIGLTEFIKIGEKLIKIDNKARLMEVTTSREVNNFNQTYDLSGLLAYFEKFELQTTDQFYVCVLTAPKISFIQYGKIVVYIQKKDLTISKQIMYSLKLENYVDKNKKRKANFPRIEITFSNFSKTQNIQDRTFLLSTYIREVNKRIFPAIAYKAFKIVD